MRDHATDPAAWMIDVTGIAGDDMDMAVHHALAGDVINTRPLSELRSLLVSR